MTDEPTQIDQQIATATSAFAAELNKLSTGTFVRGGIIKEAMASIIWSIYEQFPKERDDLADALEQWPEILREEMKTDKEAGNA